MTSSTWNGKPLGRKVIGTCAGTSLGGIDIVHSHFEQASPEAHLQMSLLHHGEVAFDGELKNRVMKIIKFNKTSPAEIAIVNIQLGEFTADATLQFACEQGFSLETDVDIIAGQGQIIWHLPLPELFEGDQIKAHLIFAISAAEIRSLPDQHCPASPVTPFALCSPISPANRKTSARDQAKHSAA